MSEKFDSNFFEFIICQNCLKDPSYIASIIDYYNPIYFNNPDIRTITSKIIPFFQKRNTIPTFTEIKVMLITEEEKQSFLNVLTALKDLNEKYNIDELYENTEQFLRERAVYNALLQTTKELSDKNIDTTKILDTFNSACNISLIDKLGLDFFEQINEIANEITQPNNVISTGWKWLDERIGGGWQTNGRALYVFTGFTNVGKSIFLGNIAINALKQNKTVVLITLEMPETMYAKRICSNITKVPFDTLSTSIDEMKASLYTFKNEYQSKLIIKEFPTKSMTIHHMNSFVQKLIKKGIKPDLLIVDYLNLMKGRKSSGLYEEIKETSEQLRASTYTFKIPCITATQLNRKGAGKEDPGMETISESIGVSFTADVQMSIWSDPAERTIGITHLGIQKNRFGPNFGSTPLKIDYSTLSLEEIEQQRSSISDQQIAGNSVEDALIGLQARLK
jgi:replicative DNA helicase